MVANVHCWDLGLLPLVSEISKFAEQATIE